MEFIDNTSRFLGKGLKQTIRSGIRSRIEALYFDRPEKNSRSRDLISE